MIDFGTPAAALYLLITLAWILVLGGGVLSRDRLLKRRCRCVLLGFTPLLLAMWWFIWRWYLLPQDLFDACEQHDVGEVKSCLRLGADPNQLDDGRNTPLGWLIYHGGDPKTESVLLAAGGKAIILGEPVHKAETPKGGG